MKIIFLNAWYGNVGAPLYEFIKKYSDNCDIFCFQEVDPKLFGALCSLLSGYSGKYSSDNKIEMLGHIYGQAIFARKSIDLKKLEKVDLYRNVVNDVGFLQHLEIVSDGRIIHLGNIHAKARPSHKLDTPVRIGQSEKIIGYFKDRKGRRLLVEISI